MKLTKCKKTSGYLSKKTSGYLSPITFDTWSV